MSLWNDYALSIQRGELLACKTVKQAVERYFTDLKNSAYLFDEVKANRVIKFASLCPHVKGHLRGERIELQGWQAFILANIFGFIRVDNGQRKYRTIYVEVPRKNGKSSLAAIIANWFLLCEKGQQDIYTAAVSRDQARIVFDDAKQMVKLAFDERIKSFQHHMVEPKCNSIMRPLAAKANTIEGTNPSCAIIDELHLHPDDSVYSAISLGMGARQNALLFAISTAGTSSLSFCKEQHNYVKQILSSEAIDESYFGIIYTLDDEKEVEQPSMWGKANPNLDISISKDELSTQVDRAKGMPTTWVETLVKRFNIWHEGEQEWIKLAQWKKCGADIDLDALKGSECYLGLDLSSKSDITAVSMIFPQGDKVVVSGRYYLPKSVLDDPNCKNRNFYRAWVAAGHLHLTPSDVIDYEFIERDIAQLGQDYDIKSLAFDPWNSTYLVTQLQQQGFTVEKVGQGYRSMSPSCKEIEAYTKSKRLVHDGNPVLNWAMSNVVLQMDPAGNVKLDKSKSPNKIDPIAALVTGFFSYMTDLEEQNIYQSRGAVVI
ncbi:terminase large subunit [Glaciecola petra]|uniref:Terminase TerL endonuclease subunit n=1 Tax=Glaciecola petra TaxID=3075602 RepID=A0ABU2ZR83_9ALTE|nr:terminase TerL endonuclease subunit [Aestuariibacter sp. P117]MDT0594548.1 terminase TerL endonuclease subunit [Aestuariibacter sp. P117]